MTLTDIQVQRDVLQREFIAAWQAYERAKADTIRLFEAAGAAHGRLLEHKLAHGDDGNLPELMMIPPTDPKL